MSRKKRVLILLLVAVPVFVLGARAARDARRERALAQLESLIQQGGQSHADHAAHMGAKPDATAHEHQHVAHMRWTTPRAATPEDAARAELILATLRVELLKYKDYRVAVRDGYLPFHPEIAQRMIHFTNNAVGLKAAFRFDAAAPTSLLYKKTDSGYELIGAMYTAPRTLSEAQLDQRVPLSIAKWHAHVNICLPPRSQRATADWTRFGPAGSIATSEQCSAENGRWVPQIFGWMVHVYPFESTAEKIWTH